MARNNEEEILALEIKVSVMGYAVVEQLSAAQGRSSLRPEFQDGTAPILIGELQLIGDQFRWIAGQLRNMSARTPPERKRLRQEISKRAKKLGEVVQAKYIQLHLAPFLC